MAAAIVPPSSGKTPPASSYRREYAAADDDDENDDDDILPFGLLGRRRRFLRGRSRERRGGRRGVGEIDRDASGEYDGDGVGRPPLSSRGRDDDSDSDRRRRGRGGRNRSRRGRRRRRRSRNNDYDRLGPFRRWAHERAGVRVPRINVRFDPVTVLKIRKSWHGVLPWAVIRVGADLETHRLGMDAWRLRGCLSSGAGGV